MPHTLATRVFVPRAPTDAKRPPRRVWKSPQAGVYDNVFDDLDTTPVDFHYSEPCDISPDPPYDSYAATDPFTSLAGYDGSLSAGDFSDGSRALVIESETW